MDSNKIVVLCPREAINIVGPALCHAQVTSDLGSQAAEDAVEDMVVCLAAIEAAWAAGEFKRLSGTLRSIGKLAARTGLPDVAEVAATALGLVEGQDDVALAAVVARLVRNGEASLATLLEISYRQI